MKNMRAFLMSFLVVASICVFSGCATTSQTSQDSYTVANDSSGFEKKQPAPTENMNAVQKTGYYLGWFALVSLYAAAGGSPPILPPNN